MPDGLPRIAYLTAGAAGMYCGSCLHDNTLARSLMRAGCDVQLIPTYTPIRTDEDDVSGKEIFFGGINVFLQQKLPLLGYLPRFLDRWLDTPWLINRLAAGRVPTSARGLGALTVSMLRGEAGRQHKEVGRLVDYLASDARTEIVVLSNILIAGCVPAIKQRLGVPVLVTLQGDDLFLEDLPLHHRDQAIERIGHIARHVDGYVVFSDYYADFMSDYLRLPREKFRVTALGIDTQGFSPHEPKPSDRRPAILGYLARHCPAKGLHLLVDAFIHLRHELGAHDVHLHTAGWLGEGDRPFFESQRDKLGEAGLADAFRYEGVVDRSGKIEFLQGLDVLSVPTTYRDPKGLFVLEALAAGVPVVQPDHGAFPELLAATGGGRLFRPGDARHLAETLHELLQDDAGRRKLAEQGKRRVHESFNADAMTTAALKLYREYL